LVYSKVNRTKTFVPETHKSVLVSKRIHKPNPQDLSPTVTMTALRVVVFFENAELPFSLLPWGVVCRMVEHVNALWKTAETPDVKYRTLPEDDGVLYVTPGVFDECRCSEVEARLGDMEGHFDFDDHHFHHTTLPKDIDEKYVVFAENDEMLRMRYLTKDIFPFVEGLSLQFRAVDWDAA
jgi:hypothetical protein